ncbi:MAG TPA: glycine cleavage T C-terminal barrel domain-containing protein [Herpetosiphonaceae bacterium]
MTQAVSSIAMPNATTYRATLESVVRFDNSARGRLRLTDRDRAQLLQRLTTNDIVGLTPGEGARSVLINSHARILDLLTVYALPEHLLVTCNPGQGGALMRFLQSRVFFQDKVGIEDLSSTTIQIDLYGPQVAALLAQATSVDPQEWPLHHIQAAAIGTAQVWLARTLPIGGAGFSVFAQRADAEEVQQAIAAAEPLDENTYDVLRIEQGYPAPRHELSTEYIPLETGLTDAVSFTKGCYVGQEIIARMESRNRLAKRLMGLRLDQIVAPGSGLHHEDKEVGTVTSAAHSPRYGSIGLAYIRAAAAVPGTRLRTADGNSAEVIELPLAQ